MKTVQQILARFDEEIENLTFCVESSTDENPLKLKREGALAKLQELRRFITDDKWVGK